MRKIQISHISKEGENYFVFLSSEQKRYFRNKKEAEFYINKVNKYLTELYILLNESTSWYYNEYRKTIFLNDNLILLASLKREFQSIESVFDWVLSSQASTNYAAFTMAKTESLFISFSNISSSLLSIAVRCCNTVDINRIKVQAKQLERVYNEFQIFNTEVLTSELEVKVIKLQNIG